jgi:cytochrome c oxidase cbb3-type subunit 3
VNCAPCHGNAGEGSVGPNLTDDYWLHGGSVQSIFKTIKYGVPEKGMKSWKEDLSPAQMAQVTSYIKSLRGTNPPNPKEHQGVLYIEEESENTGAAQDSTAAAAAN